MYIEIEHDNQYTDSNDWLVCLTDDGILIFANTKLFTNDPIDAMAYIGILQSQGHELDPSYFPLMKELGKEAMSALKTKISESKGAT